jgi:PKD repeat protein
MKRIFYMKPIQYTSLVLVVILGFVTSCSDDDNTPPQAAATFTASKTTVEVGEEVQFTNSSQNATAFKWSFGDGTTSKEVSPKKMYTQGGSYVVSLVSTGAGGSSISSTTVTVVPDQLYYINYEGLKISRLTLDPTQTVTDIFDLEGRDGVGLAYDAKTDRIYYSDFKSSNESKIWSMKLDGSDAKVVVDGLSNAYQIAIDAQAGKIYWADDVDDDYIGHIGRANLDGSELEKSLVSKDEVGFKGIALDTENNKMYYYDDDWNEDGTYDIYVANLDGTNEEVLIPDVWGYALAIDTVHDKIYFNDQTNGLFMANLDGTTIVPVAEVESYIYGIVIDYKHNKLLWSERNTDAINRANLDGSEKETLKSGVGSVRGLFLKN